jgi:hypothetical protein
MQGDCDFLSLMLKSRPIFLACNNLRKEIGAFVDSETFNHHIHLALPHLAVRRQLLLEGGQIALF